MINLLSWVRRRGKKGDPGTTGATPNLSIGTVQAGAVPAVIITGTSANPVLNFTVKNGVDGAGASPGAPVARALVIGTVYQATDNTKSAFVTVNVDTSLSAIVGALNNITEIRIGSASAGLSAGTSGFPIARTRSGITGLIAVVGLLLGTGDSLVTLLPPGWFFCVRQASGNGTTISSAYDQALS